MNTKPAPDPVRQAKLKLWLGVGTIVVIGFIIAFYVVFVSPAEAPTVNGNANTVNANRRSDIALVDATPQAGSTVDELSAVTITFSEPIDSTTISQENFYVLQGVEEKVPATISFSEDAKTATYTFAEARTIDGDTVQAYTVVIETAQMTGAAGASVYVPGGKATWNVYVAAETYVGD
ncbi:MAG: Ig-like domain-containing protein [Candidatus Kerfeldbacteria bacterium]|nr:Ig-like domain-containing protein [Candidatus Kerfeldbacteria bacterium]